MGVWDEAEGWMSGLLSEIYAVMKPLVNPLVEKWDSVVGDADAVYAVAGQWHGMASSLEKLADFQLEVAAGTAEGWKGLAHTSYDEAIKELARQIREIGTQVDQVGGFLESAAKEVQETEQLVKELIFELIEWAAITLAVSAAGAIFTFGASVAAGAAAAAGRAAITAGKIANLLRKVAKALEKIRDLIKAYKAWLKTLSFKQRFAFKAAVEKPLVRAVTGLDGDWKTPAIDLGEVHYDVDLPAPLDKGAV